MTGQDGFHATISPQNYLHGFGLTPQRADVRNALNFSGGPGALPERVLRQVQESIVGVPEIGLSILGASHRSDWFASVVAETEGNIRTLLGIADDFHVLFLQGGATQQFSTVPMALLHGNSRPADYLHTGYWSGKSVAAASREGAVRVVWSGADHDFARLPDDDALVFDADAPYLHYVSNETVEGLQFQRVLGFDHVPRICDMSSDFLSKPCDAKRFSLIYAHAQKNLGPAGVTIVLLRKDLVGKLDGDLPAFLDYRSHIQAHSNFNTPPVFAIYVVMLVTRWLLQDIGGLAQMAEINRKKAECLYGRIDGSKGFYRGRSAVRDRSSMNATFNLPTPALARQFLEAAASADISGLSGHRALGGLRASLYNGVTHSAVEQLADFMADFQAAHDR
jgi:phosphoserine aminotransferase